MRCLHLLALGALAGIVLERPRLFLPLACLLLAASLLCRSFWLQRGRTLTHGEQLSFWLPLVLGLCSIAFQIVMPQYAAARTVAESGDTHQLEILNAPAEGSRGGMARLAARTHSPAVELQLPANTEVFPGDRVTVRGRLERPRSPLNPGAFQQRRQLHLKGCFLLLQADSVLAVERPPATPALKISSLLPRLREKVGERLDFAFGPDRGGLAAAMLIGDKADLDTAVREDFRRANLSHLLVVSGSNLATVLLLIMSLLRQSGFGSRLRRILAAWILFLFAALTGFDASVSRALVCALLTSLARLLERPSRALDRLILACLLTFLVKPRLVLSTGYLMSFSASAAILGLAPILEDKAIAAIRELREHVGMRLALRRGARGELPCIPVRQEPKSLTFLKRICRSCLSASLMTLSAQLALLPFLVNFGQGLGVAGYIANLLALPLAALLTALLLPAALLPLESFPVLAAFAAPLLSLTSWLLDRLTILARWAASAGFPEITLLPRDLISLSAAIAIVFAFSLRRSSRRLARQVLAAALLLLFLPPVSRLMAPDLTVYFYAVGQGDATLLDCRGGPAILIDTGTAQTGMRVLPRALAAAGRRRIDLLILTHWDLDHSGAASSLIEAGLVRSILWPPADDSGMTREKRKVRDAAQRAGVQDFIWPECGLELGTVHLESLVPVREEDQGSNAHSRACSIEACDWRLLLLADLEAAQERRLVTEYGIGRLDVVRIAHHGSRTSSDSLLVAAARPSIAIVSVGANSYGHPDVAVLESWLDAGSRVLRTDRDGCIRLDIRAHACRVRTMREAGYGEIPETD